MHLQGLLHCSFHVILLRGLQHQPGTPSEESVEGNAGQAPLWEPVAQSLV